MATALFQFKLENPVIDEAAGTIRGCRIATLGAVANAREGEGRGLVMDAETITALFNLAKANGDRLPAFFTHAWFDDAGDGLQHDAGVWREFAIDDAGNLTATFNAFETPHKAGIFSRAKADPDGIAISPLFDYAPRNGSKTQCTPTAFLSSDFVKRGAINKALFSETQTNTMDINELIAALADPAVKTALKAVLDSHEDAPAPEAVAEMEADAGVTEEDKKPEDEAVPAIMRAQLRIARATARFAKASQADRAAILAEAATKAEAAFTAKLGSTDFTKHIADVKAPGADGETFITAQLSAGCPNRATAIARMAKDKPELYATFRS